MKVKIRSNELFCRTFAVPFHLPQYLGPLVRMSLSCLNVCCQLKEFTTGDNNINNAASLSVHTSPPNLSPR